jgi:hypothetical protein
VAVKIFWFISILLITANCSEEPPVVPPPPPPSPTVKDTITVNVEDVTHQSIVFSVNTTKNNPNSLIEVYRQFENTEIIISQYPITITDTTIIDDNSGQGLQLNTEYSYYAVRKDTAGEKKDTSNVAIARTLAATNFNYTWQEYRIGEWNSVLYDVWGTDENNVFSCGIVIINDTVYGVIHWNGNEWKPEKRDGGAYAIFGFSNNDIWVVGGSIFQFNGLVWNEILFNDQILVDNIPYFSVWGTSSNNLYFGSGRGKIIHWDGNNAAVVYTNPDIVQIRDLDGYSSDFIVGVGTGMVPPLLAVYYDGNIWSNLPINSEWSLNSTAIVTKNEIYFGGDGIFKLKGSDFSRIESFGYYIRRIEYNRQTGVAVATSAYDGVYIHNGLEWRNLQGQVSTDETTYTGIFIINNTIFCVGSTINEAKIIIGKN